MRTWNITIAGRRTTRKFQNLDHLRSSQGFPHHDATSNNGRVFIRTKNVCVVEIIPRTLYFIWTLLIRASLLKCAIKFTNDPPAGMRAGLKRTFYSVRFWLLWIPITFFVCTRDFWGGWSVTRWSPWFAFCSDDLLGYSTAAEWKPLLYAISFFHRLSIGTTCGTCGNDFIIR